MKVSVIIPLHNKADYIGATLDSVAAQIHREWEAVVVENHSSDEGPRIVADRSRTDSRFRLLEAPDAVRGPGAARNHGIENSTGAAVLFLDADDLILPEHLSSLVDRLEGEKAAIAASDWLEFVDGSLEDPLHPTAIGGMTKMYPLGRNGQPARLESAAIAYAPWAVHSALVRRDCLSKERRWIPELDAFASEDTAFWFRVLEGRRVAYTRRPTALYRTETANFRNRHDQMRVWFASVQAYLRYNLAWLESSRREPDTSQCESLVRLWESLVERARYLEEPAFAQTGLMEASVWLSKCRWAEMSPGMKIRRILGIRLLLKLVEAKSRLLKRPAGMNL